MSVKVITFCNKDFLRLAALWIESIRRLGIDNYLIIATDTAACDKLKQWGVNTRLFDLDGAGSKSVTGPYRMNIVRQYLADGTDVVLTDLDIVWKKNILTEYEGRTEADIYASQEYFHAARCAPRVSLYGAMRHFRHFLDVKMCCGFLYIRSTPSALRFFDVYVRQLTKTGSKQDQPAFNLLLMNTRWNTATADTVWARHPWFRKEAHCSRSDITGYNREFDLKLCLISMLKVQRGYLDDSGYLYHYIVTKTDKYKFQYWGTTFPKKYQLPKNKGPEPAGLIRWLIYKAPGIYDFLKQWHRRIRKNGALRAALEAILVDGLPRDWISVLTFQLRAPVFAQMQKAIDDTFQEKLIELYRRKARKVLREVRQEEFVAIFSFLYYHDCLLYGEGIGGHITARDVRDIYTVEVSAALEEMRLANPATANHENRVTLLSLVNALRNQDKPE